MVGKKGSFGRRRNVKCAKCGRTFSNNRYLLQHQEAKHNNNININNNNNNIKTRYKNKNLFKRFINYIMKIILLINNEIEIKNYIGDKLERKKAIYDLTNDVPNKEIIKKTIIIKDGPEEDNDKIVEELVKENPNYGDWGTNIDKKVNEYKENLKKQKIIEEREKEIENRNYERIYNFLCEFDNTPIKKNKYDNIKIKRNIIESIKDKYKEKIITATEKKISDQTKKEIKLGIREQPIIDYEADFLYPKISARELFLKTFPDKKYSLFAINYINKYYYDFPTDEEIEEIGDTIYSHYTRVLSGNGYYLKKIEELKNKLLEYYTNGGESFSCEYCKKYITCKRRHCLHCKNFLKELDNDPNQLILKKYLENNYKKIKIEEINLILEHFKEKNSQFIKKYLPGYIKFKRNIRIKWIKKQKDKLEMAEKLGVEVSQLPPVFFNTGLAKKLFKEITNFKDKKK